MSAPHPVAACCPPGWHTRTGDETCPHCGDDGVIDLPPEHYDPPSIPCPWCSDAYPDGFPGLPAPGSHTHWLIPPTGEET